MQIGSMATPLVVEEWEAALTTHPDQVYVQFLVRGLRRGFGIGLDRANQLRSVHKNVQSAEVVLQYLAEEVAAGRALGPLPEECVPASGWHVSRFGVIPKPPKPNKW